MLMLAVPLSSEPSASSASARASRCSPSGSPRSSFRWRFEGLRQAACHCGVAGGTGVGGGGVGAGAEVSGWAVGTGTGAQGWPHSPLPRPPAQPCANAHSASPPAALAPWGWRGVRVQGHAAVAAAALQERARARAIAAAAGAPGRGRQRAEARQRAVVHARRTTPMGWAGVVCRALAGARRRACARVTTVHARRGQRGCRRLTSGRSRNGSSSRPQRP